MTPTITVKLSKFAAKKLLPFENGEFVGCKITHTFKRSVHVSGSIEDFREMSRYLSDRLDNPAWNWPHNWKSAGEKARKSICYSIWN